VISHSVHLAVPHLQEVPERILKFYQHFGMLSCHFVMLYGLFFFSMKEFILFSHQREYENKVMLKHNGFVLI